MEVNPKAFENVKSRLQHIFQLGAMKAEKIKNTCQVRWKDYLNQSYTSSEFCHEEIESLRVGGKKASCNILFLIIQSLLFSPGKYKSTLRLLWPPKFI